VPTSVVFGLDSFGDTANDAAGNRVSDAQTIRDIVDQARLAEELGLYGFSLGEHHREDFAVSAPDTLLAGIATATSKIKLGTAVTILSTDDPVRVYERFATLQALSNGRAQITVGRGSYLESFKLFGFAEAESGRLFEERVDLLFRLLEQNPVTWRGQTRSGLNLQELWPKLDTPIDFRYAVGGSPESALKAGKLGAQLSLSVISGDPTRFTDYVQSYRDALAAAGKAPQPVSVHGPGFIGTTDDEAIESFWPMYDASYGKVSRERGRILPPQYATAKDHFVDEVRNGALYVGSAATVAAKVARTIQALVIDRFDFKYNSGPMSHEASTTNITAFATDVVPRVRKLLSASA
jgi:alkanesulfonate monooxygenase SsuD/methylene tetrahydromethanopterin reductase-like flavin-dependent oxidoreductase (luciferase family)